MAALFLAAGHDPEGWLGVIPISQMKPLRLGSSAMRLRLKSVCDTAELGRRYFGSLFLIPGGKN